MLHFAREIKMECDHELTETWVCGSSWCLATGCEACEPAPRCARCRDSFCDEHLCVVGPRTCYCNGCIYDMRVRVPVAYNTGARCVRCGNQAHGVGASRKPMCLHCMTQSTSKSNKATT